MGSDVPPNTPILVSWGAAAAARVSGCGFPRCHVRPGVLTPQAPPQSANFNGFPPSDMVGFGPAGSDDEGWVSPSSGSMVR
jgi:hypothetical protein